MGRTPRELLASVSGEDMTEMMAFGNLEPFGSLADDFRAGQIAAVVANVNRDPEKMRDAWTADDFMPALAAARGLAREPKLLPDVDAQSDLLDRTLFGGLPR